MSELTDLYQEVILDHNRKPRNFGQLDEPSHRAQGDNPLCGDRIDLMLTVRDGTIENVAFRGTGCAISTASASLMTEAVKGRSLTEADRIFERFHHLMTDDDSPATAETLDELGKLAALSGVREYPMRVKCATLAWHTLRTALREGAGDEPADVSTEIPS